MSAFSPAVSRVEAYEFSTCDNNLCRAVSMVSIVTVENKLIGLCWILVFLLNAVLATTDFSCAYPDIDRVDVADVFAVLDDDVSTILNVNSKTIIFFYWCPLKLSGNIKN